MSVSPVCGVRAAVNVIDEPVKVYSEPPTNSPLRYKRRLAAGLGAEASVKVRFVPFTAPAGISPSVKFVADPVPAIR